MNNKRTTDWIGLGLQFLGMLIPFIARVRSDSRMVNHVDSMVEGIVDKKLAESVIPALTPLTDHMVSIDEQINAILATLNTGSNDNN